MTDTRTATTAASKPMWKRCDGCKARIFNEAVDIAAHRANCPADLARALQKLTGTLETLKARVDELAGQVDETLEVLTIDPNSVDEEGFATIDTDDELAAPETSLDDAFDDEDELDTATIPASRFA